MASRDAAEAAVLAGELIAGGPKARVAALLEALHLRPLDAAKLGMAYALEWAGDLLAGVANNGAGFDIALGAKAL